MAFLKKWLLQITVGMLVFGFSFTSGISASAQSHPTNIKVLDEHSDGHGNIVRTVQFNEGLMRVTQTIIEPRKAAIGVRVAIKMDTARKDSLVVLIKKSDYILQVWYRQRLIRTYKAVFGPNPLQNKLMEGDRNTPEGMFRIANKNEGSKYDRFMQLNYPNDSSYACFNRLKASGQLPASAKIGGNVGIHGIWQGGDDMIQLGIGWTDGCIALKNKDIEDLFSLVSVGTRVYIRK
ncbi:MAG: L,D-transpeptidase [Chitinophagaceae bacterium]